MTLKATHRITATGEPATKIRVEFIVEADTLERAVVAAAHDLAGDAGTTAAFDDEWLADAAERVTKTQGEDGLRRLLWADGASGSGYRYEDAGDEVWAAARERAAHLWPDFFPNGPAERRLRRPVCPTCGGRPFPPMDEGTGSLGWTCQDCGDEWYTDADGNTV